MRRVGALLTSLFEPAALPTVLKQHLQEEFFLVARKLASAKLAEHRKVDARIPEFETEDVLPVDATAHRFNSLSVRVVLHILHDTDQRQAPRGFGERSQVRIDFHKQFIGVAHAWVITQLQVTIAFGPDQMGNTGRFLRDWGDGLWFEGHGILLVCALARSFPVFCFLYHSALLAASPLRQQYLVLQRR